ncbi:sensory transduction histidine kinase [Candidatus Vecturithrix granuli]|uniref:histidine kinase n=1 Tax=Vecturithrix granuli TaxID=1499967 RepID=A0A081C7S8_VECG1|nr:sensory transduction histidine kinase [Candidatus Vecturithrix granuli]
MNIRHFLGLNILVWGYLIIFCCGAASADVPVRAQPSAFVIGQQGQVAPGGPYSLDEMLTILPDVNGDWTLDDVTSAAFTDRFQPNETARSGLAADARAYWVRLNIDNRSEYDEAVFLQFVPAFVVDLYLRPPSGEPIHQHAGLFVPFAEWTFPLSDFRYPLFSVTIPKLTTQTLYARLAIEPRWLNAAERQITATIRLSKTVLRDVANFRYVLGVMVGLFLGLGLYLFVVFLSVRDRAYLYFSIYVLLYSLLDIVGYGIALEWLWPGAPRWNAFSLLLLMLLIAPPFISFSQLYLQTQTVMPRLHRLLTLIKWSYLVPFGVVLIAPGRGDDLIQIWFIVASLILLSIAVKSWRQGFQPARIYLSANLALLLSILLYNLTPILGFSGSLFLGYCVDLGVLIQIILSAIGLAQRITIMRQEKDRTQTTLLQLAQEHTRLIQEQNRLLEQEVAERTYALQESEERFRALAENSLDTIMRFDREYRHLYVNPVVETLTGLPVNAFPGKTHAELGFPTRLVALWEESIDSVFTSGQPHRIEFELPTHIWLDWLLIPERAPDGTVRTVLASARDITEYKHAVEALRESEERFRNMFERHSAVMLLVNPETGRIITANQAAVNYYGYSAEAFQGMPITQINHLPFENIHAAMQVATHTQQNYFQFQHHLADGTVREVEVYSTPIPFQGQQMLFSIIHDITERKRVEEALLQAKEAAEFANLSKTNFLRSVSHELRTPLNHILGFARILESQTSGALNPRQAKYIATILASSDHLLKLIEDILMLSQLDFEKTDVYLSDIPLKRLLENSVKTIREKDLKQALTLTIKLPPELETATIKADQRKLMQVLFQLLTNAVKFTPDGGAIVVDAECNGEDIVIRVTDTGIGIAPEDQEHIFAPFYQVRSGLANKTPGTGLGLPIARRLVELHGGKLWVSSTGPGAGSCFSFSVPQGVASQMENAYQRFDDSSIVFQDAEALSATSAEVEITPPPRADLEALHEMAILGKVFEIQEHLQRLEVQDARYKLFARKVWVLAKAFEVQQIATMVKSYLDQL